MTESANNSAPSPEPSTPEAMVPGFFSVGGVSFAAFGDRILIEEDPFRSGYECLTCSGKGVHGCPNCSGLGIVGERHLKCSHCSGSGTLQCAACAGKGGILTVPEVSERRPTTGRIVSIGSDVLQLHVGDSVLYSSYAGYTLDLQRAGVPVVLRIIHEPEVLSIIRGHLSLRDLRDQSSVPTYTP